MGGHKKVYPLINFALLCAGSKTKRITNVPIKILIKSIRALIPHFPYRTLHQRNYGGHINPFRQQGYPLASLRSDRILESCIAR